METIKSTKEHTIFKKRNGRFAVQGSRKKWINGDDKRDILLAAGLIKVSKAAPKPVEEEVTEAASEQAGEEATE
jgi:hypothetical protein